MTGTIQDRYRSYQIILGPYSGLNYTELELSEVDLDKTTYQYEIVRE